MHTHNSFGAAFQGICLHLNDPSEQRKGQRALWAAVFFVMRSCIQYIGQILLTVHLGLHIIIVRQSVAPLSFCQFSFLTDCFFYAREAGDTHRSPCASVAVQSLPPSRTPHPPPIPCECIQNKLVYFLLHKPYRYSILCLGDSFSKHSGIIGGVEYAV